MYTPSTPRGRRAMQGGLAAVVALTLSGAAWHGLAAESTATAEVVQSAVTPESPAVAGEGYADVVDKVAPAVVTIRTEGHARMRQTVMPDEELFRRFFGDRFFENDQRRMPAPVQRGLGSGVVTTADGYILTNHHVIDGADSIRVELLDGRSFDAELVGTDAPSDLAVLKIEGTGLPTLPLGDSDAVRVGDIVLAVGNPMGIGQTVTAGIVSAKGRSTGFGDGSYEDFLQTDAPINHGNSGGALVNLEGELIGINSQILSPGQGNIGIGFAIPANMARHVMSELQTDGHVRRAQMGVVIQPVTSEIAESLALGAVKGAIVSDVDEGSPADRAGIERGDVILSFNGHDVTDTNALRNRVASTTPGTEATVVVLRDGRERTLSLTLREIPTTDLARGQEPAEADRTALGVAVAPLTPELRELAGLPDDATGLMVQSVNPESRAASAGIREGDGIAEVNQKPVENVQDLRAALKIAPDRPVLLLVSREGRSVFVTVRPS
ncbi:MAG: DegQ family serine endoprotease [Vicinamibacterales bacterium]